MYRFEKKNHKYKHNCTLLGSRPSNWNRKQTRRTMRNHHMIHQRKIAASPMNVCPNDNAMTCLLMVLLSSNLILVCRCYYMSTNRFSLGAFSMIVLCCWVIILKKASIYSNYSERSIYTQSEHKRILYIITENMCKWYRIYPYRAADDDNDDDYFTVLTFSTMMIGVDRVQNTRTLNARAAQNIEFISEWGATANCRSLKRQTHTHTTYEAYICVVTSRKCIFLNTLSKEIRFSAGYTVLTMFAVGNKN